MRLRHHRMIRFSVLSILTLLGFFSWNFEVSLLFWVLCMKILCMQPKGSWRVFSLLEIESWRFCVKDSRGLLNCQK